MQHFNMPGVGIVTIQKSSRARRLILKITPDGEARVTIPAHMPYMVGERFAKQHRNWFIKHMPQIQKVQLYSGKQIGQSHQLQFKIADVTKATSRVQNNIISVLYPPELSPDDESVQAIARQAAIRALKKQADAYLPSWLHGLAVEHGYKYKAVSVKKMKSRWGSCSSDGSIALSIWLMQLPDELVEYVLCHELTHLKHRHHQADFWQELSGMLPDCQARRKRLHAYQPALM